MGVNLTSKNEGLLGSHGEKNHKTDVSTLSSISWKTAESTLEISNI